MARTSDIKAEIDHWFSKYFEKFIEIGAGRIEEEEILDYWGVPLHMSGPSRSRWFTSPEDVMDNLKEMQGVLKQAGYTHTEAIDRAITTYSENASRVETIMSRRRADGSEIDRAAISFEIRRTAESWIIISAAARPTEASQLRDVW